MENRSGPGAVPLGNKPSTLQDIMSIRGTEGRQPGELRLNNDGGGEGGCRQSGEAHPQPIMAMRCPLSCYQKPGNKNSARLGPERDRMGLISTTTIGLGAWGHAVHLCIKGTLARCGARAPLGFALQRTAPCCLTITVR